jgi:hypothetical protein
MKKSVSTFAVVVVFLAVAVANARDKHAAPVPSRILSARTIYVDNETPDADLQLNAVMGLSKWGRYDIVDAPQKADIVLRIVGSASVHYVPANEASRTYNPKPASYTEGDEQLAPPGCTRLEVVEPRGNGLLWSETRKTGNVQERARLIEGLHDAVDQQERSRH